MNLESVRLLHAQGIPNRYIANQVYRPIDDSHAERGTFFILFDQPAVTSGAFVSSLINTLIREYYRQPGPDRLAAFEQTLVRLNDQIGQYQNSLHSGLSLTLNGVVVLYIGDEIHITHVGSPRAYLQRHGELLALIDAKPSSDSTPLAFSVITSGEVLAQDCLVLIESQSSSDELMSNITFALSHDPLYESGRAYARIMKQKLDRESEALFVRFADTPEATYQIYVDRALETSAERWTQAQKAIQQQLTYIGQGITVLNHRIQQRIARTKATDTDSPAKIDKTVTAESSPTSPEQVDNVADFSVKTYWDTMQNNKATKLTAGTTPVTEEPITSGTPRQFSIPPSAQRLLRPRTAYLLIGALLCVGIVAKVINNTPSSTTQTMDTTTRDSFISQADTAARNADAALVQDDTSGAINYLIAAQSSLRQISREMQTETSKTLLSRITDRLDTLTKTTHLTNGQSVTINAPALKVIDTTNGIYALGKDNRLYLINQDNTTTTIPLAEGLTPLDGVAYNQKQAIAVLAQNQQNETVIMSVTASDGTVKEVIRTDKKAWPTARMISSFDRNLYLVGSTMWKATPQGEGYRATAYTPGADSTKMNAIVMSNGFFYGIEESRNLVRLATNSPKTAIKFFGAPEAFWPQTITRISTNASNLLYLFDKEGQRLIVTTTDGGYRKQYALPNTTTYIDVSVTDTAILAMSDNHTLTTFPL